MHVGPERQEFNISARCPLRSLDLSLANAVGVCAERDRLGQLDGRYIPSTEEVDRSIVVEREDAQAIIACLRARRSGACDELMIFCSAASKRQPAS